MNNKENEILKIAENMNTAPEPSDEDTELYLSTALDAGRIAQVLSRIFKTPAIPFLIAGIMALVPGNLLYSSIYMIITGSFAQGEDELMRTLIVAGTIALAIFLIDTVFLTERRIRRKKILRK